MLPQVSQPMPELSRPFRTTTVQMGRRSAKIAGRKVPLSRQAWRVDCVAVAARLALLCCTRGCLGRPSTCSGGHAAVDGFVG